MLILQLISTTILLPRDEAVLWLHRMKWQWPANWWLGPTDAVARWWQEKIISCTNYSEIRIERHLVWFWGCGQWHNGGCCLNALTDDPHCRHCPLSPCPPSWPLTCKLNTDLLPFINRGYYEHFLDHRNVFRLWTNCSIEPRILDAMSLGFH